LKLKNGYFNTTERISFSIEIIKCNKKTDPSCKAEEAIEKLLTQTQFNLFLLEENIDFANKENIGKRPVIT